MAVNIQRQQAFGAAFNQYPDILEAFVEQNVWVHYPIEDRIKRYGSLGEKQAWMGVLMAQFITRLIQTRARNSDSELMTKFAEDTVERYKNHSFRVLQGGVMQADDKYLRAVNTVEQGMSSIIFTALMQEAEIDEVAEENNNQNREFDEADFWHDVMLGLGVYYRKARHPRWWAITQEIFLDHKSEFKKALADENRLALEAEVTPTPEAGKPSMVRH